MARPLSSAVEILPRTPATTVTITLTDTVGTVSVYSLTIPSAAYVMHIKKGGRAVGFGTAAGSGSNSDLRLARKAEQTLEVSQGGTGASNAASACGNIGAVKKSGDTMTGNLYIQSSLYPSLYLQPTYNGTTNRTVFEGSYAGASSFSAWDDASRQQSPGCWKCVTARMNPAATTPCCCAMW